MIPAPGWGRNRLCDSIKARVPVWEVGKGTLCVHCLMGYKIAPGIRVPHQIGLQNSAGNSGTPSDCATK